MTKPHLAPLRCPACKQPLLMAGETKVTVWCGYGPCESKAANDGAIGNTLLEAVKILQDEVEKETYGNE